MKQLLPVLFILLFLPFKNLNAQIKLKTNIGDELKDSGMFRCEYDEKYSKIFNLSDFGIGTDEQFHITKGAVGVMRSDDIFNLNFGVYKIDENFPESDPMLIGTSWMYLPAITSPEIVQFDLQNSIVVPSGVERILVVVGRNYTGNPQDFVIAGTQDDTSDSWFMGCREYFTHTLTSELDNPVPDANFYITATGETFRNNNSGATTTLSHSNCDELIDPPTMGCSNGGMSWSRDFYVRGYGISADEEFIINSGQVGISSVDNEATIQFRIFEIDDNFPESFSENDLIGESQIVTVNYFNSRNNNLAKIFNVKFDTPVTIPRGVERILVQVYQTDSPVFPAATEWDDGSISWFKSYAGGCTPDDFTDIRDLGWPDIKLYINVTGNVKSSANHFQMNYANTCTEFLTEFSIENASEIASIRWDFGDPDSGSNNTSNDTSPFHDFSADGIYTITANIKGKNGNVEVLTEKIEAKEPPKAYGINNLEACESSAGTGISNSFDTSNIRSQILGKQTNKIVTFIDGSGNEYDDLPNPFTNTIRDKETIKVRVARNDNPCCYDETTFDLIINPSPDLSAIENIFQCSSENNGFATFDLTPIQSDIISTNITTKFFYQDGGQIPDSQLNKVVNKIKNQEIITVQASDKVTGCHNETEFIIGVTAPPKKITFPDLTSCDDNNDGISEYFDTSAIRDQISSNNENVKVSFFNSEGKEMSELPNPYTNLIKNEDYFTVRLTDETSGCYSENKVLLKTSSKPNVNQPVDIYGCDEGNGYAYFDTRFVKQEMIGQQNNLKVTFFDRNGNELSGFTSQSFENQEPYNQEIVAKIESISSEFCYDEVHFSLKTQSPQEINLEDTYQICYTNDALTLNSNEKYESTWFGPNGEVLSNTSSVTIQDEGIYGLSVLKEENGVICESYKEFELVHSESPAIDEISYQNFAENSKVEIFASGDGEFEYSLDRINFQDENLFENVEGGEYKVTVRDKFGCGQVSQIINLINYDRFFTPNNDGIYDTWTIKGISNKAKSFIQIYDRYGKLLKRLDPTGKGWDGTYNGKNMPSADYWFQIKLNDGDIHTGHFSLVRS